MIISLTSGNFMGVFLSLDFSLCPKVHPSPSSAPSPFPHGPECACMVLSLGLEGAVLKVPSAQWVELPHCTVFCGVLCWPLPFLLAFWFADELNRFSILSQVFSRRLSTKLMLETT